MFAHAAGHSPPNPIHSLVRSECRKAEATSAREDGYVQAGQLKRAVLKAQPDFEYKKSGIGKWKKFLESTLRLDIKKEDSGMYVKVRPEAPPWRTVEDAKPSAKTKCETQYNDERLVHRLVRSVCKEASASSSREDGFVRESIVKSSIMTRQPDFDYKKYGFKKWLKFLKATPRLDIKEEEKGNSCWVRVRPNPPPAEATMVNSKPSKKRKRTS